MNPPADPPKPVHTDEDSTGTRAARVLSACLEEVEHYGREVLERVCKDHPRAARAIRERMSELRAAGLGSAARRRVLDSAGWENISSLDDSEETDRYEPIGPYQPLKELAFTPM